MVLARRQCQLDRQLKQLVLEAQQHPPQSLKRQKVLNQLIATVQVSGRLLNLRDRLDRDRHKEMEQKFWLYVCHRIERYEPGRGSVIAWLNSLLYKRFYREELLAKIQEKNQKTDLEEADFLNNYVSPETDSLSELKELIALDPDRMFQSKHVKNYPQANFQKLTELHLAGYSWEEISKELGVKASTLSSFYWRTLDKLRLLIREYLIT